jgi:acetyl-CoA carboxylase carboxyltransferase component
MGSLTPFIPNMNAGAPDARDSNKMGHFCEVCDQFHIPLVFLVDVPGFMIGPKAEAMGTLRAGMRAMHVGMQATVPRFTVIIRKCYGMAGALNYVNDRLCNLIEAAQNYLATELGPTPKHGARP